MVAFVAKVLESCAESLVFKPPNPWTMAIMSVLCELHAVPDLKVVIDYYREYTILNVYYLHSAI